MKENIVHNHIRELAELGGRVHNSDVGTVKALFSAIEVMSSLASYRENPNKHSLDLLIHSVE